MKADGKLVSELDKITARAHAGEGRFPPRQRSAAASKLALCAYAPRNRQTPAQRDQHSGQRVSGDFKRNRGVPARYSGMADLHRWLEDGDAALALLVFLRVEVERAVGIEPVVGILRPCTCTSRTPRVDVVVGRDGARRRVKEGRLDVPHRVIEVKLDRRRRPRGRRYARAGRARQARLSETRGMTRTRGRQQLQRQEASLNKGGKVGGRLGKGGRRVGVGDPVSSASSRSDRRQPGCLHPPSPSWPKVPRSSRSS